MARLVGQSDPLVTGKRWSLPKKKMARAPLISARPTVRRRCDWAKERVSLCLPTASGSWPCRRRLSGAAGSASDRRGGAEAPAEGFHQPRIRSGGVSSGRRRIVFVGSESSHERRTWIQDLDGGKARAGHAGRRRRNGAFSRRPLRRRARCRSEGRALSGGRRRAAQAIEGVDLNDEILQWSADQKSLYVGANPGRSPTARIDRYELSTGRRELWKEFTLPDPTGINAFRAGAITSDGEAVVFVYFRGSRISTSSTA